MGVSDEKRNGDLLTSGQTGPPVEGPFLVEGRGAVPVSLWGGQTTLSLPSLPQWTEEPPEGCSRCVVGGPSTVMVVTVAVTADTVVVGIVVGTQKVHHRR